MLARTATRAGATVRATTTRASSCFRVLTRQFDAEDWHGGRRRSVSTDAVKAKGWFDARYSEEMPMRSVADAIGDAFAPALDAIVEEQTRREVGGTGAVGSTTNELYVPSIPSFLCATRLVRDSEFMRNVLVVDERAPRTKPRLSWYDARDESWVPRGWYSDGLKADFSYYFGSGAP
mmetsp:Transcript_6671/g.24282  ORF Transcript_6671/g.24282 Transcript_6671/m.24282 type:complete len:177 (-) Transcript_6671:884-1414(-)